MRSEFAAGWWLPRPLGDGSRASEEAAAQERSGDICQGAGDTNLQVNPPYYSAQFVFYPFPSSCLFPAYGSVNLCVTLLRTRPPSLSLLRAPAILLLNFHIGKDPVTNPGSSWPFTSNFTPSKRVTYSHQAFCCRWTNGFPGGRHWKRASCLH